MRPRNWYLVSVLLVGPWATGFAPSFGQDTPRPAPDEFTLVALGETVEFGDGNTITVADYEEDVPFESDGMGGLLKGVANLFKAKICAGSDELEYFATEGFFWLVRPEGTGHSLRQAFPTAGIREPRFNDGPVPGNVAAGTCHEGWVVIAAPDKDSVHPGSTAILFDNTRIGFISEELHLKLAWELE